MKRLLTYLFLIFCLGLVFQVNGIADKVFPSGPDRGACVSTFKNIDYKFSLKEKKSKCFYWISHEEYPDVYINITMALYNDKPKNRDTTLYLLKGTFLEVLIKENSFKTVSQLNNLSTTKLKKTIEDAKKKAFENRKKELLIAQKKAEEENKKKAFDPNSIAALIDKSKQDTAEVKTQKNLVSQDQEKNIENSSLSLSEEDALKAQIFGCWSIPLDLPYDEDLLVRIKLKLKPDGSVINSEILDHARMNKPGQGFYKVLAESALRAIKLCQPLRVPTTGYERWKDLQLNFDAREMLGTSSSNTKIVKKEPAIAPKKEVKVAKVEEPKQEEFKPANKDVDNEAPIIDIVDSVTVNNQTFTLKGKVTDKSKLYIEANNRPLTVAENGEFKLDGFVVDPETGEQIKLVAIDQWQNKSEKIIKINVEFKDVAELRSYEDPNPNKIKVKEDKNKIAIIIGIEKYRSLKNIDAPYANRDANAFRAYANRALGIPNKNIKVLIDENATRGETLKALTLWLPQAAKGKNKDIYIFFAGHGLASDDGKNLYILPQDGDAALLQYTAISRLEMFELINKVEPNSVTMFFDTCYSGQTRDEEMLIAGLRPIRLTAEEQDTPNNFTIFTASNYDQTSGSINQAKHGIFSYYLMKGMEGQADSNQDKKITNGELIAYLKQNVSEEAFINNRQQEPMLSGDPDKVLISFQ